MKYDMKDEKKQNREKEKSENDIDPYDIMLEAIKWGLMPRTN